MGVKEIKDEIREVTGMNKAKFNYKTANILKSYLCCLCVRKYSYLRENKNFRQKLYFEKGYEKLNKELDLAYFVQ